MQDLKFDKCNIAGIVAAHGKSLNVQNSFIESLTYIGRAIDMLNVTAKSIMVNYRPTRPSRVRLYTDFEVSFRTVASEILVLYITRGRTWLIDCTIGKVPKDGIKARGSTEETIFITNSHFGSIEETGIEVMPNQTLRISNTTIESLSVKSIKVNIGGFLILRDVNISSVPNGSFILHEPCFLELHSVKFNNKIVVNSHTAQFTHVYPEVQGIMNFNKVYHSCNQDQLHKANITCKVLLHSEDPNHPGSFDINSGKCEGDSNLLECDFSETKGRNVSVDLCCRAMQLYILMYFLLTSPLHHKATH